MDEKFIAIASDHGGYELKKAVKSFLLNEEYLVKDLGTHDSDSVDYPDYGADLASRVSRDTYLNIMDQYRPCYRAPEYGGLARPPLPHELARAQKLAREQGLARIDGLDIPVAARALFG